MPDTPAYCGVTPATIERWCLAAARVLLVRGPMRPIDLARELGRSRSHIGTCLNSSLGPGERWFTWWLVERAGAGPKPHMLYLTEEGCKAALESTVRTCPA